MDISSFRNRVGLTQAQLAEKLELATSSVGNLCSNTKKPSYEVIERLFRLGATIAEVFSPEIQEIVLGNSSPASPSAIPEDVYRSQAFRDGVEEVVKTLIKEGVPVDKIVTP